VEASATVGTRGPVPRGDEIGLLGWVPPEARKRQVRKRTEKLQKGTDYAIHSDVSEHCEEGPGTQAWQDHSIWTTADLNR
jgi:hypothetical protein